MLIVICTGRGLNLHNGAMIAEYPEGKVIERFPLKMDVACKAVKTMR